MLADLKELWRFRELLFAMIERELRIRYKNSFFGFFWSLLNPLITVAVMTLVFRYFIGNRNESFTVYMLAGYLPFMFFQLALMDSAQSILASLPVIRKVYFPREILPLASIGANFIHFVLALFVFFAYQLAVYVIHPGIWPFSWRIAFLPVLLIVNLALATGLALIISALNTFYEDIKYVVGVGLYLLFFLSPIMYFSENVKHSPGVPPAAQDLVFTLYHLNPIAMLSLAYRKVLVAPSPVWIDSRIRVPPIEMPWGLFWLTTAFSVLALIGGYALFNRLKWRFLERP